MVWDSFCYVMSKQSFANGINIQWIFCEKLYRKLIPMETMIVKKLSKIS